MKSSVLRQIFFNLVTLFLSMTVAFAIGEMCVRIFRPQWTSPSQFAFHPQLGPIPVPNDHGKVVLPGVYRYIYHHNSYGLRGSEEYVFGKSPNYRILLLGDSFTYGMGVNDNETFAAQLERMLSFKGSPVEVINAGNEVKGTDYAVKFFEILGHKFEPDLTVLCFFSNDFLDNHMGIYYRVDSNGNLFPKDLGETLWARKEFLRHIPGYNWFLSWSHLANLLKQSAITAVIRLTKGSANGIKLGVPRYYENQHGPVDQQLTTLYLKRLQQIVSDSKSQLMVFYIPEHAEVAHYRETGDLPENERFLEDDLKSLGVTFYSFTPLLANSDQPLKKFYYPEGHWTPLAHLHAAKFMAEKIG